MLLLTEYDKALDLKKTIPKSLVREVYLTEGATPLLNRAPTMFGKPVHFIHLGYNLRAVETFVRSLEGDTSNILLISPISRWGLYNVKLKFIKGLVVSNQFDTRESKVELAKTLTGLNTKQASKAMKIMKYNLALLEANADLLKWCATTKEDVEEALASVEKYSYTDVLMYLCGSKRHDRTKFIRTLAKYRRGKKHILKYLKVTLDDYIDHKLNNVDPSKDNEYTIRQLGFFLYLEDAMQLRLALDNVKDLTDLLKGEI